MQQYAESHNLPVFTPVSLKTPEAQARFAAHAAEAAIVAAYGLLLPRAILDACPRGCINVHPSLLPRWRGAAPIQRSIMAGDTDTAIVIMQMNEGLDTGDMLSIQPCPIPPGTTAGALHDRLAEAAGPLLLDTLDALEHLTPTPQSAEGVTYARKITREECAIDWNRPARAICQQIWGLSPAPGAGFTYGGDTIRIFDAACSETPVNAAPGTVLDDRLTIACNPGTLRPTVIQRPGKKRMPAAEALRGHPIPEGSVL